MSRLRILDCGLAAALLVGCGDDEQSRPRTPEGPPDICIAELRPAGGRPWRPGDSGCVEVGADPKETIAVVVGRHEDGSCVPSATVRNWILRPPGGCGLQLQCGYIQVTVTADATDGGGERFETITLSTAATLPFAMIPRDGPSYSVSVELLNDEDVEAVGPDGRPYSDEVQFELCPVVGGDGGVEAGPDSGPGEPDGSVEGGIGVLDASDAAVRDGSVDAPRDAPQGRDAMTTDAGPDASTDAASVDASIDGAMAADGEATTPPSDAGQG